MTRWTLVRAIVAGLLLVAFTGATPLAAQGGGRFPPDSLTNLEVFPNTIPVRALIDTMRSFTSALGVRCTFCHVGEEGQPLSSYDFASDDKRPKRVARVMLHMVEHINTEHLADVPERSTPPVVVSCETCHHGRTKPERLQTVLARQLADSGIDASIALYHQLRKQYYGSATFDFSPRSLNGFAETLLRGGEIEPAFAMARLNAEQYPEYPFGYTTLADVYLAKGDTANAIAHLRIAAQSDTTLAGFIGRRLRALGSGD